MRRTIEVTAVLDKANQYLRVSPEGEQAGRKMMQTFIESILHETDTYSGFRYLTADDVRTGEKPGIIFDATPAHKHVYPDETRVEYYTHCRLRRVA